ncbi:pterin binding enzyme family protein [Mycobacterium xenopi 4042]|uniref:Pterin binding enzyme family protein n=1 Tax=Mycobacterium xenopi 4042 TaxID=1299334 RepID=X8DY88_MYCXE|nr:pterin binding enzyme family protein [Mycobacterium xenopi 4042]
MHSTLCGRPVAADRPLIMAIVNRTPDSFYDRGATFSDDAAKAAAHRAIADGADVIDVGGVKAGPATTSMPEPKLRAWCRSSNGCVPRTRTS